MSTDPRGLQLQVARWIWVAITLLTLALVAAGVPERFAGLAAAADERAVVDLGFSVDVYAGVLVGLDLAIVLAHIVIAAVMISRVRTHRRMAVFVALVLVTNGALVPLARLYPPGAAGSAWQSLVDFVIYIGLVSSIAILYLFPDGRFVPAWTRPMAAGWALLVFFALYFPDAAEGRPALRPYSEWPVLFQLLLLLLWAGSGIYAQIYRYVRVSSPVQRQQAKWAVFGLTAAVLGPFIYFLPFFMLPAAAGPGVSNIFYQRIGAAFFAVSLVARLGGLILFTLALLVFPLSFAIAVLRYRLWDIDILINRTLVYGALTGVLALVYLVSVVLLQALFRALTGQGDDVAVIVSTLAIAGLFQPLRRRIQVAIDRRFYRRKYDAERVLESFGATLREEVDLDRLTGALLVVVEETLQPAHVSLWLREQGE